MNVDPFNATTHPAAADVLVRRIIEFTRLTRDNGFRAGIEEELDALRVAQHCGLLEQGSLRPGLRTLLCADRQEWQRFDALYETYWYGTNRASQVKASRSARLGRQDALGDQSGSGRVMETDRPQTGTAGENDAGAARSGASHRQVSGKADFRFLTDAQQLREMENLVERLARRMRRQLCRRQRLSHTGRRIHIRHSIRNSLRYGGTPLELVFRQRRRQLPRLVLLLDVSRSMSLYSYLFLRFARGIIGAFGDAEAFVFHTRLVSVTEALRERDIHRMKQKLVVLSAGWSGGTRIGECLAQFNRQHAGRMQQARTVVMIMSDGFDTGTPAFLATQLEHIKKRARRLVWLNPLLGREGYEPLAGGMQAALPWIDVFAPAHNLESLQALEARLMN